MENLRRATSSSLRMGEMAAAAAGEELRSLLGSCVGLALYDSRNKVAGLAHIVLPDSRGRTNRPGKYVDTAIPSLIEQIAALVTRELNLRAKLVGGASMFATSVAGNIGLQNIEKCEQVLGKHRIPIVARHCGGEKGRRMLLDAASGRVVIEIVGQPPIEI